MELRNLPVAHTRHQPRNLTVEELPAISETDLPPPYSPPSSFDSGPPGAARDTEGLSSLPPYSAPTLKHRDVEELRAEPTPRGHWVARHGGWTRFITVTLIALSIVTLCVALPVYYEVKAKSDEKRIAERKRLKEARWLTGDVAIPTALRSTTQECTSQPAAWKCPPSTFEWYIDSHRDGGWGKVKWPSNYTVRTADPFDTGFIMAEMKMDEATRDTADEHFFFNITVPLRLFPDDPSFVFRYAGDDKTIRCDYFVASLSAKFYTKKLKVMYPGMYETKKTWDWAVDVNYAAWSQPGAPRCQVVDEGYSSYLIRTPRTVVNVGNFTAPPGRMCSCSYNNYY